MPSAKDQRRQEDKAIKWWGQKQWNGCSSSDLISHGSSLCVLRRCQTTESRSWRGRAEGDTGTFVCVWTVRRCENCETRRRDSVGVSMTTRRLLLKLRIDLLASHRWWCVGINITFIYLCTYITEPSRPIPCSTNVLIFVCHTYIFTTTVSLDDKKIAIKKY